MRFACMGGFCAQRDTCEHYNATHRPVIVERLCDAGHDGEMTERPVRVIRAVGEWERPGAAAWLAQAQPFGGLH